MRMQNVKPISQIRRESSAPDVWYQSIRDPSFDLEVLKEAKVAQLDELCEKAILAGFTSQTTGYFFRFNQYDQLNFTQQLLVLLADTSITDVSWKTEDAGVVALTRDEFLAVSREAEAHKRGQMERYWALKEQVLLANTFEEVDAVNW